MIKKTKEKNNTNKKFSNKEVAFLIIVTCLISITVGYFLNNKNTIYEDKTLKEFADTYNEITKKYYDKIDKEKLLSGAVNGMLSTLDQYSTLLDSETDETSYISLDGSYVGVGIEIVSENENIIVIGVLDNSPAARAGIKENDIIKSIDEIDAKNKTASELSKYIRENEEKKTFKIIVERNSEKITYQIEKEEVIIKSVLSKIIEKNDKKIGYIYISIFSNTTASQYIKQLNELEKNNIDSLIIDVRENSGGHLSTVISMLSEMLKSERIMYQINKNEEITKFYSMGKKDKTYPIAIIQNNNSASASELLAISLKENLNAIIIGQTSYGKGTIQEYNFLSNKDMYKFTTKKWLSPKGNYINEIGITPDIEVELDDTYFENPIDENDNQLQAAINELIK